MIDALERVTGRIAYTINLEAPHMLHGRLLRSTVPHGRIVRIDVSRAQRVPGVAAIVTGQDCLKRSDLSLSFGPFVKDQSILAMDKVRYVGEPLAAVAAEDLDAAQEALDLIEVEYEELPAVFDPVAAMADGAPLVHENKPGNVCSSFKLRKGDVERGFAEADEVFEDTFSSPAAQQVSLETHACLAQVEGGHITVWSTSQTPHQLRAQLAGVFNLPASKVRVIVPTLGGGYGGKGHAKFEPAAVLLAQTTGRPVKIHLSRSEEFVTTSKHGLLAKVRTGVKQDGSLLARQVTFYLNGGAYALTGPAVCKNGGYGSPGPYFIPHVWVDSYCVYTNLPPAGSFRGLGANQAAWVHESQMDLIAERLGVDPFELRMKNLLKDGQAYSTGQPMVDSHFHAMLRECAEAIGWDGPAQPVQEGSRVRAKGLACSVKGSVTPSTGSATVKLNDDGSLNVLSASVEMGQGLRTTLAVLAAEQMDLPLEQVHVAQIDTDVTPFDQGTLSSRSSYAMSQALEEATRQIREQLVQLASQWLEVGAHDLEIAEGRVRVKGAPERGLSYGEVVRRSRRGNLVGHGVYTSEGGLDPATGQGIATVQFHQGAGAAEVEVDIETGRVRVVRYHGALYAGRVINRVQAELQTEGSVAFGLGQALYEEMVFDNGRLQNGNLADYMIPSFEDLPALSVSALEHPTSREVHGIGESAVPPASPAIANAVFRATGVRITDLPITPEKVLRGLRTFHSTLAPSDTTERMAIYETPRLPRHDHGPVSSQSSALLAQDDVRRDSS